MREVRRTHSSDAGLVWMLDANGKIGSHECNAIGSLAAECCWRTPSAMVALRGKGAKSVREQVFVPTRRCLMSSIEHGSLSLRVVDAYKHLVASSGSQCRELQERVKDMNSGVADLDRPELSRHEVHFEDKLQFCATLATDTRLFLLAGTWTSLSAAQQQTLHGPRMHILRRATNVYRKRGE